jgi:RNA polymerase sigma-70 factor (ECF subfamily)
MMDWGLQYRGKIRGIGTHADLGESAMSVTASPQVTQLLLAWEQGEQSALDKLIPLVHAELRRIARRYMMGERKGHSLQTTALVNEAYIRLVGSQKVDWQCRAHFFAVSAQLMRRVLVDHARARNYKKRGGAEYRVTLDDAMVGPQERGHDLVALDDALQALAEIDLRKSRVVELRFFGGMSVEETAAILHVSEDTVFRDWRLAKAWLQRELTCGSGHDA